MIEMILVLLLAPVAVLPAWYERNINVKPITVEV